MTHDDVHTIQGGGFDNIPDYYLGKLLYYDEFGDDNCRWVVYDGQTRVRCPTRHDAIDYIARHALRDDDQRKRLIISARLLLNKAMEHLDRAARMSEGQDKLLYESLAVKLRPHIVDLDNQILL